MAIPVLNLPGKYGFVYGLFFVSPKVQRYLIPIDNNDNISIYLEKFTSICRFHASSVDCRYVTGTLNMFQPFYVFVIFVFKRSVINTIFGRTKKRRMARLTTGTRTTKRTTLRSATIKSNQAFSLTDNRDAVSTHVVPTNAIWYVLFLIFRFLICLIFFWLFWFFIWVFMFHLIIK